MRTRVERDGVSARTGVMSQHQERTERGSAAATAMSQRQERTERGSATAAAASVFSREPSGPESTMESARARHIPTKRSSSAEPAQRNSRPNQELARGRQRDLGHTDTREVPEPARGRGIELGGQQIPGERAGFKRFRRPQIQVAPGRYVYRSNVRPRFLWWGAPNIIEFDLRKDRNIVVIQERVNRSGVAEMGRPEEYYQRKTAFTTCFVAAAIFTVLGFLATAPELVTLGFALGLIATIGSIINYNSSYRVFVPAVQDQQPQTAASVI